MEGDILDLKNRLAKMEHFQQAVYRGIVDKIDSIPVNILKEGLTSNRQQTTQIENRLNEIEKKINFFLPMTSFEFSRKRLDNEIRCIQCSIQNVREEIKTVRQEQKQDLSNSSLSPNQETPKYQVKVVETEFSDFDETSDYDDDTANNSELESIPIDDNQDDHDNVNEEISISFGFGDFDCFDDFDQLRYDRSETVGNDCSSMDSTECIQFGEATNILGRIQHGPDLNNLDKHLTSSNTADMQIEDPSILFIHPVESNMVAITTAESNMAAVPTFDFNRPAIPTSYSNMLSFSTAAPKVVAIQTAEPNMAVKPIDDAKKASTQNFDSNTVSTLEPVQFGEATQVYSELKYDSCLHYVQTVKPSSHLRHNQQINLQTVDYSRRHLIEPACLDFGDATDILRKLQPKGCKST